MIDQLRESLITVVSQMSLALPDSLPILGYGLFSSGPGDAQPPVADIRTIDSPPLASLFSKLLLLFAIEYERESEVSLAISANVLRLTPDEGAEVSDLPRLSGVSKEAIAMALNFLGKRGYAVIQPKSASRREKMLVFTPKGRSAQDKYFQLVWTIEDRWQARFGEKPIFRLREALEHLTGDRTVNPSPLFQGLEPYPKGWRASVPRPELLPHYPMLLHRGGFPDGSWIGESSILSSQGQRIRCMMFDVKGWVMRTTLSIDDDVLGAAKEMAAAQDKTVGEIISSLARRALNPRPSQRRTRNGVPLLPVRPDTARVTSELVNQLREELG